MFFSFQVFSVCFQLLVVFSSDVFSVFLLHVCVCVCVPHGCGIYVYDVIRDQYMFMCEHVSCCVHVCVQWVMVCCGCICFWCMWCHVCGHAWWCKYTAIKLNNSTLTLSNILIQQPSTFTIGSRWLSSAFKLSRWLICQLSFSSRKKQCLHCFWRGTYKLQPKMQCQLELQPTRSPSRTSKCPSLLLGHHHPWW